MKKFQVTSSHGADLGVYSARNAKAALDAMAKEAGYKSQADAVKSGIAPFAGTVTEVRSAEDAATVRNLPSDLRNSVEEGSISIAEAQRFDRSRAGD